MHDADVCYHLDFWLIHVCWTGAITTNITTILLCRHCYRQHIYCKTNMNAGPVQVYQTSMLVGTSLQTCDCWLCATVKDMAKGWMLYLFVCLFVCLI